MVNWWTKKLFLKEHQHGNKFFVSTIKNVLDLIFLFLTFSANTRRFKHETFFLYIMRLNQLIGWKFSRLIIVGWCWIYLNSDMKSFFSFMRTLNLMKASFNVPNFLINFIIKKILYILKKKNNDNKSGYFKSMRY